MPSVYLILTIFLFTPSSFTAEANAPQQSLPSIADRIEQLINEKGIDAALEAYDLLKKKGEGKFDFSFEQLNALGLKLLEEKRPNDALAILKLNSRVFPENPAGYCALADVLLGLGDREKSIEYINRAMEADPLSLPTIIRKKRLLLVPEDFRVPQRLETEKFRIRPLTSDYVDLDYQAVMGSKDHLQGVLGRPDWPGDLTWEEDLGALKMHEAEFDQRTGFVYTVLNHQENECLGCVYIYPSRLDEYDAEVIMWVTRDSFEKGLDSLLFQTVKNWMASTWPFERVLYTGRDIKWGDFFRLLAKQDRKYH